MILYHFHKDAFFFSWLSTLFGSGFFRVFPDLIWAAKNRSSCLGSVPTTSATSFHHVLLQLLGASFCYPTLVDTRATFELKPSQHSSQQVATEEWDRRREKSSQLHMANSSAWLGNMRHNNSSRHDRNCPSHLKINTPLIHNDPKDNKFLFR